VAEDPKIGAGAGPRGLAKAVPPHETTTADSVRAAEFPAALRGYDREAVDQFIAELADLIEKLESRQARETVVQRALEEVGEETSAILKQAHETADDITARSRSQAEDRVEVARQEAGAILREARLDAEELKRETEGLQAERATLIEELRRFASDTLSVANAAAERQEASLPEAGAEASDDGEAAAPIDGGAETPLADPIDAPYDVGDEIDEGEWAGPVTEEHPGPAEDPGPPTEELAMPSTERKDEEPPLPGR
jgi:DivIVA domain-containing protein